MSNKQVTWYKNKLSPISAYLMFWTKAFKKGAFSSRSRRTEYFVPVLFHEAINIILALVIFLPAFLAGFFSGIAQPSGIAFFATLASFFNGIAVFLAPFSLVLLIALIAHCILTIYPIVAVYFRRMNDSGMGGAFFFLFLEATVLSVIFLMNAKNNAVMLYVGIGIFVVKFICELALLLINSDATVNENGVGTKYFFEENE